MYTSSQKFESYPFEQIDYRDLPDAAADGLRYRAQLYVDPADAISSLHELDHLIRLSPEEESYPDVETYIGSLYKICHEGSREYSVPLVDVTRDGDLIGAGEVCYPDINLRANKGESPFVSWTHTRADYRHEGLGRRRLLIMNMASTALFGETLHSGSVIAHQDVHKIWQRLMEEKKADSYQTMGKRVRYAFREGVATLD